jgi:hypothetical protein
MQLDALDRWLTEVDLSWPYLAVCFLGAAVVVIEMQKIAHYEIMVRVCAPLRHMVRLLLALLGVTLMWSGYAPLHYKSPPWASDLALVGIITLLILAHALTGCRWARRGD